MPIPFTKIIGNKKKVYFFAISPNYYRQNEYRQRRSLDITKWQLVDRLYKRLYEDDNHQVEEDKRKKRSEFLLELRPVGGPINIEQLPAMLAARYVKRYPYSQYDDPATM
jgi:hypothetical protein